MPVRRGHILAPRDILLDRIIRKNDGKKSRFIIANAQVQGCPIIYLSDVFCEMCGFRRAELMQRSSKCEFLHGAQTSSFHINSFHQAVEDRVATQITDICLYNRNGAPFICDVLIEPIGDKHGDVTLLILNFVTNHENQKEETRKKRNRLQFVKNKLPSLFFNSSAETNRVPSESDPQESGTESDKKSSNFTESIFHLTSDIAASSSGDQCNSHAKTSLPYLASSNQLNNSLVTQETSQLPFNHTAEMVGSERRDKREHVPSIVLLPPNDEEVGVMRKSSVHSINTQTTSFSVRQTSSMINLNSHSLSTNKLERKSLSNISSCSNPDISTVKKESDRHLAFADAANRFSKSGIIAITEKVSPSKVAEVLKLDDRILPSHQLQSQHLHRFTILHYGSFKVVALQRWCYCKFFIIITQQAVWDWMILILVIYTAVVTPFSTAFLLKIKNEGQLKPTNHEKNLHPQGYNFHDPLSVIELLVDIFFVVDILINFRTTYVNKNEEVVSQPRKIAAHYFKGWFIIDLVAALPFDLLVAGTNQGQQETTLIGLLKTARLLRLVRVARKIDRYSEFGTAVLFLLMCSFALVAHWFACIWYAIGNAERTTTPEGTGWLSTLGVQLHKPYNDTFLKGSLISSVGGPSTEDKYVTSLYFTISSLTSVGFGNVSPNTNSEKIFSIAIMLFGSLMYACIFGNVSAIIQRLYSGTTRYHIQMLRVKEFLRFHKIPNPLRQRLEECFQHAWSYTNGIDMNMVLKGFPDCLQADICLHLNRTLLQTCPAFKTASQGCLRMLSVKFKTTHVPPGNPLFHAGALLTSLYFIIRGSIEIIQNEIVVAVLREGCSFGEYMSDNIVIGKSKATVCSLTYCDLHKIERVDLLEVLDCYPEFRDEFWNNLDITFNLRTDGNMTVENSASATTTVNKKSSHLSKACENLTCRIISMPTDEMYEELAFQPMTDDLYDAYQPCLQNERSEAIYGSTRAENVPNSQTWRNQREDTGLVKKTHVADNVTIKREEEIELSPMGAATEYFVSPRNVNQDQHRNKCCGYQSIENRISVLESEIMKMKDNMQNDLRTILNALQPKLPQSITSPKINFAPLKQCDSNLAATSVINKFQPENAGASTNILVTNETKPARKIPLFPLKEDIPHFYNNVQQQLESPSLNGSNTRDNDSACPLLEQPYDDLPWTLNNNQQEQSRNNSKKLTES